MGLGFRARGRYLVAGSELQEVESGSWETGGGSWGLGAETWGLGIGG